MDLHLDQDIWRAKTGHRLSRREIALRIRSEIYRCKGKAFYWFNFHLFMDWVKSKFQKLKNKQPPYLSVGSLRTDWKRSSARSWQGNLKPQKTGMNCAFLQIAWKSEKNSATDFGKHELRSSLEYFKSRTSKFTDSVCSIFLI